jgi:hypothetical protein
MEEDEEARVSSSSSRTRAPRTLITRSSITGTFCTMRAIAALMPTSKSDGGSVSFLPILIHSVQMRIWMLISNCMRAAVAASLALSPDPCAASCLRRRHRRLRPLDWNRRTCRAVRREASEQQRNYNDQK